MNYIAGVKMLFDKVVIWWCWLVIPRLQGFADYSAKGFAGLLILDRRCGRDKTTTEWSEGYRRQTYRRVLGPQYCGFSFLSYPR